MGKKYLQLNWNKCIKDIEKYLTECKELDSLNGNFLGGFEIEYLVDTKEDRLNAFSSFKKFMEDSGYFGVIMEEELETDLEEGIIRINDFDGLSKYGSFGIVFDDENKAVLRDDYLIPTSVNKSDCIEDIKHIFSSVCIKGNLYDPSGSLYKSLKFEDLGDNVLKVHIICDSSKELYFIQSHWINMVKFMLNCDEITGNSVSYENIFCYVDGIQIIKNEIHLIGLIKNGNSNLCYQGQGID